MRTTPCTQLRGRGVRRAPEPSAVLAGLMDQGLVLLEADGVARMDAMMHILGSAGESQTDAIARIRGTVTRLAGPTADPGH